MKKLLLINNDEQSLQPLKQDLKNHGYDVTTTNQSHETRAFARPYCPDLILIDIDIPIVNGLQTIKLFTLQFVRFLREANITQPIPVIIIANRTIPRQLLIQAGFDTYVRKPVSLRNLLVRIEVLLDTVPTFSNKRDEKKRGEIPPGLSTISFIKQECTDVQPQAAKTVAYVSDASVSDHTIADFIQNAGYSYTKIPNSFQAYFRLFKLRPQLIFIDSAIPTSNHYELCTDIRKTVVLKETPIILLTDSENIVDRLRARLAGASDLMCKPINRQHIVNVLTKYAQLSDC